MENSQIKSNNQASDSNIIDDTGKKKVAERKPLVEDYRMPLPQRIQSGN
jgi:hypothetical protein